MADNKAFAKAVAPRKTIILALQKSIKHLSLLVAFRQTLFQIKPLLSAKTLGATKAYRHSGRHKTMKEEEEDFVYSRIGMALISTQRVEFITGQLIEVLQNFDGGNYQITSAEFLEQTAKSKKTIKTLGTIFKLLKLNPTFVIEEELDSYLKKRNLFVHSFWITHMQTKSPEDVKTLVDFCYDFGRHSERIESFFKGFIFFLSLRYVKDRDHLDADLKNWDADFDYFMKSLKEKRLKNASSGRHLN